MFDHLRIHVSDIEKSKAFYLTALQPLGYRIVKEVPEKSVVGFGTDRPRFWLRQGSAEKLHIAFEAKSRAEVDAFYAGAMAAGGKDNGAPGPRQKEYSPHCYAAFVFDPNGNNVEVDCHTL